MGILMTARGQRTSRAASNKRGVGAGRRKGGGGRALHTTYISVECFGFEKRHLRGDAGLQETSGDDADAYRHCRQENQVRQCLRQRQAPLPAQGSPRPALLHRPPDRSSRCCPPVPSEEKARRRAGINVPGCPRGDARVRRSGIDWGWRKRLVCLERDEEQVRPCGDQNTKVGWGV